LANSLGGISRQGGGEWEKERREKGGKGKGGKEGEKKD